MLPDGFHWTGVHPNDHGTPTVLAYDHYGVLRLLPLPGGRYRAMLDYHHPQGRSRECTSYESGKAGAELWATRHQDRLRREVEERRAARRAKQPWLPKDHSSCDPGV